MTRPRLRALIREIFAALRALRPDRYPPLPIDGARLTSDLAAYSADAAECEARAAPVLRGARRVEMLGERI